MINDNNDKHGKHFFLKEKKFHNFWNKSWAMSNQGHFPVVGSQLKHFQML